MSTNESNYSYSQLSIPVNKTPNEALMKAVRVTTTVKNKIANAFKKNFTVAGIEQQQVSAINATLNEVKKSGVLNEEDDSDSTSGGFIVSKAVDETEANLIALANKLTALETQKKVVVTVKRMVLYTKELVALVKRITKKWFPSVEKVQPKVAVEPVKPVEVALPKAVVEEKPEEVSFNWDTVLKSSAPSQPVTINAEKTDIPSKVVEPVIEQKKEVTFELPTFEKTSSFEEKVVTPVDKMEMDIPTFSSSDIDSSFGFLGNNDSKPLVDNVPTGNTIMARMYKLGTDIRELNVEKSKLKEELKVAQASIASANDDVNAYKKVNKDLSDRIATLTSQIKSLTEDVERLTKEKDEITKKNEEVMSQMRTEYEIALKSEKDDKEAVIAEYERKLADQSKKYSNEMARINAEYKASMQMIYDGMQNISDTAKVSTSKSTLPDYETDSYAFDDRKILQRAA